MSNSTLWKTILAILNISLATNLYPSNTIKLLYYKLYPSDIEVSSLKIEYGNFYFSVSNASYGYMDIYNTTTEKISSFSPYILSLEIAYEQKYKGLTLIPSLTFSIENIYWEYMYLRSYLNIYASYELIGITIYSFLKYIPLGNFWEYFEISSGLICPFLTTSLKYLPNQGILGIEVGKPFNIDTKEFSFLMYIGGGYEIGGINYIGVEIGFRKEKISFRIPFNYYWLMGWGIGGELELYF